MQVIDIKMKLESKGYTQTAISEALSCSPSLISKVVNRKAKSIRVATAVAKLLEIPFSDVFPEYEMLLAKREEKSRMVARIRRSLDVD